MLHGSHLIPSDLPFQVPLNPIPFEFDTFCLPPNHDAETLRWIADCRSIADLIADDRRVIRFTVDHDTTTFPVPAVIMDVVPL